MVIEAFLFDLDGTLVDSARDLASAVNRLRRQLNLAALPQAEVLSYVGDGATRLIQRALPADLFQPCHLQQFLALYAEHLIEHSTVYPGIRDFLHQHRHRHLAVVTNKPWQLAIDLLRGLELLEPFALVIGGDSLTEKKPHPLPILHSLHQLGVAAEHSVMIGDHHTDLRAAAAAGVRSCFCHYGFGHADALPSQWSVASASELLRLFP